MEIPQGGSQERQSYSSGKSKTHKEGGLLIRIGGPKNRIFENEVIRIVGEMGKLRVDQGVTLEICDLDSLTQVAQPKPSIELG